MKSENGVVKEIFLVWASCLLNAELGGEAICGFYYRSFGGWEESGINLNLI